MTAGERSVRAKSLLELDKELQTFGIQESKYENLRPMMNNPEVFGPVQQLSQLIPSQTTDSFLEQVQSCAARRRFCWRTTLTIGRSKDRDKGCQYVSHSVG